MQMYFYMSWKQLRTFRIKLLLSSLTNMALTAIGLIVKSIVTGKSAGILLVDCLEDLFVKSIMAYFINSSAEARIFWENWLIPGLLMPWILASPGHQQAAY